MDESTLNGAPIHQSVDIDPRNGDPNGDGPQKGVPGVSVKLDRAGESAAAHNATLHPSHAPDNDMEMPLHLA